MNNLGSLTAVHLSLQTCFLVATLSYKATSCSVATSIVVEICGSMLVLKYVALGAPAAVLCNKPGFPDVCLCTLVV